MTVPTPLIDALIDQHGCARIDADSAEAFIAGPGERILFLTGDPAKNLETNDVAVILPQLMGAFDGRFQVAVVDRDVEDALRERYEVWPTPSLIFLRSGAFLGAIPKVRDWSDYLKRVRVLLEQAPAAAE